MLFTVASHQKPRYTCQGYPGYFSRAPLLEISRVTWQLCQESSWYHRADSRFAPSQWEMALLCTDVSHWLSTNLESALYQHCPHWELGTCPMLCQYSTVGSSYFMLIFLRSKDHSGHGLSQWKTMLQCNVVSHWLSLHPELSQRSTHKKMLHRSIWVSPVSLTHWGLVTPFGDTDLGQHWLR